MDPKIVEAPTGTKKKREKPAGTMVHHDPPTYYGGDEEYWKTLMDRMLTRCREKTVPAPKPLPKPKRPSVLDGVLAFIRHRRRTSEIQTLLEDRTASSPADLPQQGDDVDGAKEAEGSPQEVEMPKEADCDKETEKNGQEPAVPAELASLSEELREAFEQSSQRKWDHPLSEVLSDETADLFAEEDYNQPPLPPLPRPAPAPPIIKKAPGVNPLVISLAQRATFYSSKGHQQPEVAATINVTDLVSKCMSTPSNNDRPYVKSLMRQLNIEPGGIASRFSAKSNGKKRKHMPLTRGNSGDLLDDILGTIKESKNMIICGVDVRKYPQPENLAVDTPPGSHTTSSKFVIDQDSSQNLIPLKTPRVPYQLSPGSVKLRKSLGLPALGGEKSCGKRRKVVKEQAVLVPED